MPLGSWVVYIDDDARVIKDLDYYKNVKGFNCNDKNLEEKLFEYIEAIQEFEIIRNKI